LLLFFSYFSTRIRFLIRKYYGCGHVIKCPVNGIKSPLGCSPCSIITIGLSPNFGTIARSSYQEIIQLQSLKIQSVRQPLCRIYPDKVEEVHITPSILNKRRSAYTSLFTITFTVTVNQSYYYILYETHVKCVKTHVNSLELTCHERMPCPPTLMTMIDLPITKRLEWLG
jgi:hypothetical protein